MRSKKALKNIIFSLILQLVTIACGFIIPKLIISNFGSDVNGLISSITQFLAYISLLESGIGPVIKSKLYKPLAKKNKKEIQNILYSSEKFFKKLAKIFVVYIIILCFCYPIIVNNQFDNIFTISLLLIISISTFAEYYFGMTYKLFLQADQKNYITSYFQIITTIFNTICVIVLIKIGANILLVKLISSFLFVIRPLLQNLYIKRKYNFNLKNADKNYEIEQKWDGLAQHIAAVVHGNTDITILTLFSNVLEISVYSVYMLVVNGVKRLVEALTGGVDGSFGDMIAKKEDEVLNKSFRIYELFYFSLITIIFNCTLILIVPFVKLYTQGITDVNYIRPVFAIFIVLAEFTHSIRLPYSSITLAAGHFKETKKGAWVETLINIIISIILVFKYGIIGVAIGTLVAMLIRTIEFSYHTSKYILKRKYIGCLKWFIIIIVQTLFINLLFSFIKIGNITNFVNWIIFALLVFGVSFIIIVPMNYLAFKKDVKNIKNMLVKILKRG